MDTLIEFAKTHWTEISAILTIFISIVSFKAKDLFAIILSNRVKTRDLPLFNNLEKSITSLEGYSIIKNREVFRLMIKIKLNCWIEESHKLANILDNAKFMNGNKLRNLLDDYLINTVKAYRNEWTNRGIPTEVQNIFNEKHREKIDQFDDAITFITLNRYLYPSKMSKITAVFDKLDMLLYATKTDLLEICTQEYFNGRLSGIEFNGVPLSDDVYKLFLEEEKK